MVLSAAAMQISLEDAEADATATHNLRASAREYLVDQSASFRFREQLQSGQGYMQVSCAAFKVIVLLTCWRKG